MTPAAYIDSGNLELYALGRLTPEEQREAERYLRDYPEVRAELLRIETALEELALSAAPPPPPAVLQQVLSDLRPPDTATAPVDPVADVNRGGPLVWLGLILFALAALAAVYYYNEYRAVTEACDRQRTEAAATERQLALITNPATRSVTLAGTDNAPASRAVVFYNPAEATTLFTAANLPAPPSGRQYQLWAIDAEGPKSIAVLDRELAAAALLQVDYVPETATFAITLETEGGNPTPNLEALQVIGNVEEG